ncbi:hypothetical protein BU23DRAFT_100143 [Bimuria novae-zelandiae CBS 107.79]|uniref:Uncharacterized protein n=1 Tax=Bimuria novae-zelandiae CBS 107.79 TaxID=1447943 RepID=A0A6A5VUX4_9PLEO|nr:hypothetical protein BU23DRAFT_100143 [Bimuria novae-zelandiae CBS 107.79]
MFFTWRFLLVHVPSVPRWLSLIYLFGSVQGEVHEWAGRENALASLGDSLAAWLYWYGSIPVFYSLLVALLVHVLCSKGWAATHSYGNAMHTHLCFTRQGTNSIYWACIALVLF